jgi:hypothetical protein
MRSSPRAALVLVLALLTPACADDNATPLERASSSTSAASSTATSTAAGTSATANPPARDRFSFVVIGDYGVGTDSERRVAAQVERWVVAHDATALLTAGDNIYPDGDPSRFDAAWHIPYGWVRERGVRVLASLGNHDHTDRGEPVMRLLGMPSRWYRATVGSVEVLVLDANRPADTAQREWLQTTLARSTARWTVAVFHQPAYSCSLHDTTPAVVANWVPLFEQYGVDLVLSGHDHNYQRFAPRHGVTYVVTGAGGAPLYAVDACTHGEPPLVRADDDVHGFVAIEGDGTRLRIRAVSDRGQVLDDVTLP